MAVAAAALTQLFQAARDGRVEDLRRLATNENVTESATEEEEEDGGTRRTTALHVAAARGRLGCVKALLQLGAQVDQRNEWGQIALHVALERRGKTREKEKAEKEEKEKAEKEEKEKAKKEEDSYLEIIEALLKSGSAAEQLDARTKHGYYALQLAIWAKQEDLPLVRLLLQHGADVNTQNDARQTPLFLASQKGLVDVIELLLAKGADVNHKDKFDVTPLHRAAAEGKIPAIRLLLKHGASRSARDYRFKRTPEEVAAKEGHPEAANAISQWSP
jgi:ankyrin repeat protein